jgi:DNA polymerase-3 subunit gamma/tau
MDPDLQRPASYRVLARAYRPTRLSALIGQDALVRTLKNAFASGRVAHAFLLSGIRGIGKTTTARIIARGLNCTGEDGKGGPTPEPCGVCPSCRAIDGDRSLDVIEMDAASQTGKDSILDLLEGIQFVPTSSRYKVYILDEVHMLSTSAWNALLKTVEEPPPHAKFIFATTEIRKVPITVLSRCQRFELRRVEAEALAQHLETICAREGVKASTDALVLIARAAEGSVRDALSLLDQAIATSDGPVEADLVQNMLGLGDRLQLLDLFDAVMRGAAAEVLDRFQALYALGADPAAVIQDLLEIGHWLSRLKVKPDAASSLGLAAQAAERARAMAQGLSLPVLARAWQMLLRGIEEVRIAPDAAAAAEMLLLRLACVSDLPSPAELARLIRGDAPAQGNGPASPAVPAARPSPVPAPAGRAASQSQARVMETAPVARAPASPPPRPAPANGAPDPRGFAELVAALRDGGEAPLAAWLHQSAHLLRFEPGRLELRLVAGVPSDVVGRLGEAASRVTGRRWIIVVGSGPGEPTLAQQQAARRQARLAQVREEPAVKQVLAAFPGAEVVDIRPRSG